MAGIRIKHRSVINRVLTIVDGSRPYSAVFECSLCHRSHEFKTYHIDLDGEGAAIVSPEVWSYVQRIPEHGFELTNEVQKPPSRRLAVGFAGTAKIVDIHGKEIESGDA
jgi:hypothetical protein